MISQLQFNVALTAALESAATPSSPRSDLQGVQFHFCADGTMTLCSTTGQVMTLITLAVEHGQPAGTVFFMPSADVQEVLQQFPAADGIVTLCPYDGQMIIMRDADMLTINETPVAFPSYAKLFDPKLNARCGEACFAAPMLIAAVQSLRPFTDKWVSFRAHPGEVSVLRADVRADLNQIIDVSVAIRAAGGGA